MEDQILEKKTIEHNPAENKSVNDIQRDNEIKSLCKYDIIVFGAWDLLNNLLLWKWIIYLNYLI